MDPSHVASPSPTVSASIAESELKDSAWAMKRLGYRPDQRVAFWQLAHAHNVPMVRMGPRRIMFDVRQVEAWIANRSTSRAA
jgi:hypothetical protein